MDKVTHKVRGLCTVWAQFDTFLILVDINGNRFECTQSEIQGNNAGGGVNVVQGDFGNSPVTKFTPAKQIDINDRSLTAAQLAVAVRGLGKLVAKAIIQNRPEQGYLSYDNLSTILIAAGVEFGQPTLSALKNDGVIIFGGIDKVGLLTPS
jgi:hypothetical protein